MLVGLRRSLASYEPLKAAAEEHSPRINLALGPYAASGANCRLVATAHNDPSRARAYSGNKLTPSATSAITAIDKELATGHGAIATG
jgi:hypothetical protein